jgi:uncharacterized protein (TIGR02594 family)
MPKNESVEALNKLSLITRFILDPKGLTKNCPWMKYAIPELGIKEAPGDKNNPRVVEYLETVGFKQDSIDWCSAFVSWCMKSADNERSNKEVVKKMRSPAGAQSWLVWGMQLTAPRFGAVTVLKNLSNPIYGHVAFYLGEYSDQILLLGGNQNHEVSVSSYEKKQLLQYRWSIKTFGGEKWV